VRRLCPNVSKLDLGRSLTPKLNFPPKTCMPRSAKIMMDRNSSKMREAIDWMELSKDATKFDSDLQYLSIKPEKKKSKKNFQKYDY
jgi:hypothetical protein